MVEIIKTDWGVANTYKTKEGYQIEINSKLDEFPEIKEKVLRHEFEHTRVKEKGHKGFIAQRKIDALTEVKFKDLFPFYKKNPKTFFQQMSPITYSKQKNTLFIEWTLIFLYTIYLGIGYLVFWLINTFSTNQEEFFAISKWIFIIGLIVFIIYKGGKLLLRSLNKEIEEI